MPVGSTLAQQILAAKKRPQQQSQQPISVQINAPSIANQQLSSQLLTSQQAAQQPSHISTNQKPTSIQLGQLLSNQQTPIQIGHISSNQQGANLHLGQHIITQNAGSLQVRSSQSSAAVS